VAEPADRHPQRRRAVGRRGGPRRQRTRHEPEARRPPRVLREARGGDGRGRSQGAGRGGSSGLVIEIDQGSEGSPVKPPGSPQPCAVTSSPPPPPLRNCCS